MNDHESELKRRLAERIEDASDQQEQAKDYMRSHSTDEMAADARARAETIADNLRRQAETKGEQSTDKINDAMSNTGQQMHNLAQTVRERAPEGQMRDMAHATADALDKSGRYLREHDVQGVRQDFETFVRRNPMQSLLISAGIGFLLARRMRG